MRERRNRQFSEDFKRKKVSELDRNLVTISELCREYQISRTSVYRWMYLYSRMKKKDVKQIVEAKSDSRKLLQMKEEIKELQRIIGEKQILLDFKDKMIELAEGKYGVDIKKNFLGRLLWYWQTDKSQSQNDAYSALWESVNILHQKLKSNAVTKQSEGLLDQIREIRTVHPQMSSRLMYKKIQPDHLGRDRFEAYCFKQGFKVKVKRAFHKTTNSLGTTRFPNLAHGLTVTGVNQVWTSDITFYRIGERFYYLTLIGSVLAFNCRVFGSANNEDH